MIPVNEPLITDADLQQVTRCIRAGWISSAGPFLEQFEAEWARFCGRKHGVAVSSGTAALQVAARALELTRDDEVILPTFTIISCALAVVETGATPVLVDSDPVTWTMDIEQVREKISPRTRAIMPVHIYGHPVDMDPLLDLADEHGIAILEDAAEAHGAEYLERRRGSPNWRRCGSFGAVSTFSFYANKIITTGEGGMALTDDDLLAARLRSLRNLCFQPQRRFVHENLGYNYRLTSMQAAIGLAQIERIAEIVERKHTVAGLYTQQLQHLPGVTLPAERAWARNVYWMYGLVLDSSRGVTAADMARRLLERGVETRPFFVGMHEQPVFRRQGMFQGECYPVAEQLARYGLYLPSGTALTDEQIELTCDAVTEVLEHIG